MLALLPGSERPDEYVIYTAHWDHFGKSADPAMDDPIFNGAFDNATGTAGLIELARAFAALPERPARSVLFLAVTAEEQGLIGSAYYAANPVYPTASTVATINIDGMNVDGPMNDVTVVGMGASELDDYLADAAARVGRTLRPDPEPEKGYYYRSDHFSFAKIWGADELDTGLVAQAIAGERIGGCCDGRTHGGGIPHPLRVPHHRLTGGAARAELHGSDRNRTGMPPDGSGA